MTLRNIHMDHSSWCISYAKYDRAIFAISDHPPKGLLKAALFETQFRKFAPKNFHLNLCMRRLRDLDCTALLDNGCWGDVTFKPSGPVFCWYFVSAFLSATQFNFGLFLEEREWDLLAKIWVITKTFMYFINKASENEKVIWISRPFLAQLSHFFFYFGLCFLEWSAARLLKHMAMNLCAQKEIASFLKLSKNWNINFFTRRA